MPNPDEVREEAWRAWWELVVGDDEPGEDTHDPHFNFMGGWDARGQHDAQQIAALEDALRRYMLYVDSYGYESTGPLAQAFGPVEIPGSSISTEAWLDRVLREPALRALGQSEEVENG